MASGNRVDELESTVKELQATVNGLTDELVEAKVRIRELEDVVEDAGELDAVEGMADTGSASESGQSTSTEPTETAEPAADAADTDKSEAPEEQTNEESESSDIIIA